MQGAEFKSTVQDNLIQESIKLHQEEVYRSSWYEAYGFVYEAWFGVAFSEKVDRIEKGKDNKGASDYEKISPEIQEESCVKAVVSKDIRDRFGGDFEVEDIWRWDGEDVGGPVLKDFQKILRVVDVEESDIAD